MEDYIRYSQEKELERLEKKRKRKKAEAMKRKKFINKLKVYGLTAILAASSFKLVDSSKEISYDLHYGSRIEKSIDDANEKFDKIYLFYRNDFEKAIAEDTEAILQGLGRKARAEKFPTEKIKDYGFSDNYYISISSGLRNGTRTKEMSYAFNDYDIKDPFFSAAELNPFSITPTELSYYIPKRDNTYLGETVYVSKNMSYEDVEKVPRAICAAIYKKEVNNPNAKFDIYQEMLKVLSEKGENKTK